MNRFWSFLCAAVVAAASHAAGIESFEPQGEHATVGQVQARFSEAMVPLGQSDAPAPFEIDCVAGNGYWTDAQTWVYDLASPPEVGRQCRFLPRAGLATLAGSRIESAADYTFRIAGPRVVGVLPDAGATVDEGQVFVLVLNATATAESIEANTRCEVQGIYERIPARRLADRERQAILELPTVRDELEYRAAGAAAVEVVQCRRPLPANAKFVLVWGQGIATAAGQTNPADQVFAYGVRDHFVARLRCQRENARAGCLPMAPIRLEFTAEVARKDLDTVRLRDAAGKTYRPRAEHEPFATGLSFPGPFPPGGDLTLTLPTALRDDAGRALLNQDRFPLRVRIGELPPLVKFAGDFGIIERAAGGVLPITLRRLEPGPDGTAARIRWVRITEDPAISAWMRRLREFDNPRTHPRPDMRRQRLLTAKTPGLAERALPKPDGADSFEVVGLPLEQPGYYVLEAESRRLGQSLLGEDRPMYVRAAALVTNLAVHFKWGPKNSLAWVTTLDRGEPAAGARIAVLDCRGRTLAQGITDAKGMSLIPAGLPDPRRAEYDCPLLVTARLGDDLSFARSDWDEGIETWRFGLPEDWGGDDRIAHSVLDRPLYRTGETVHMKHLLRDKRPAGLAYPTRLPKTLEITHGASDQRWFLPLLWKNGAATTDWRIPSTAKRGAYALRLLDKEIAADAPAQQLEYLPGLDSGSLTVADFRVPLMRATLTPTAETLVGAGHADYDVRVGYLNGGAAKSLPVKLRGMLEPRFAVSFDAWPEHSFAGAYDGHDEQDSELGLASQPLTLDAGGAGRARLDGIPARTRPQTVRVELEYADPAGEIQTVARTQTWWPAAVVLGVKRPDWVRAGQSTKLEFLAIDPAGKALAGIPIRVNAKLRHTLGYRVRLAGGFYGYRDEQRDTPLATECSGHSDANGRLFCEIRADDGGEIIVDARAQDAGGRESGMQVSYWVAGRDEWWFGQENHDRIDLLPEKARYRPGETARMQVRMPFREATALVTVERDGILDARVVPLSGKAPVIEVPVRGEWAPNVFVSALVVRGRVDAPPPTALVDLAKPAFKLGIAQLRVDSQGQVLEVGVKADRETYQTREKAKVHLRVRGKDGKPPPRDTEVIVAAVDEGLLELADNRSWDVLTAMLAERGYNLRTFTAQMQVTGKRHYGRKAVPIGGGGGRLPTRELFDTLLYWNPAVRLDRAGEARIEVPLNDSLTRFRVVAVATAEQRFGSASTSIRTSRDLQIASGLPTVVRQGDRLQGHVSLRNASDRPMEVAVGGQVSGVGVLASQRVKLAAGDGRELTWSVKVPEQAGELVWSINASEVAGKGARDALKVTQQVAPVVAVRPVSGQLLRLDRPLDLEVGAPASALPGRGEIRATLAATLADGLTGVRNHMRAYPYPCLEQKTSAAVATGDARAWSEIGEALPGYLDGDGLAAYFPGMTEGSVTMTAYLLTVSHEAGVTLPAAPRTRMLAALRNFAAGRLERRPPSWLPPDAATAQRLAALAALARHDRSIEPLLGTVAVTPTLWRTSMLLDWIDALKHAAPVQQRAQLLRDAQAALRARLRDSGQRLTVGADDGLWWLMTSPDVNATRALLTVADLGDWKAEVPKLVNGALARQSRGHWDTTTANAWGSLAMRKYVRLFETTRPDGQSTASLAGAQRAVDWKALPNGATAYFPLPAETTTLSLRHQGRGAPYVTLATLAALDLRQPMERGFVIKREWLPVERKTAGKWSRGDIVRVRLTIDAREAMGWVAVEDPIPAGAAILGSGLKRDSALLTAGEQREGMAWPAWEERRFDGFRAYYEQVPRGRFSVEYTLRLNNEGHFNLPSTRVEAMYAPEMFAETPNADLTVHP